MKSRISAIEAEASSLRQKLDLLQAERDKLSIAVEVWEDFDEPRAAVKEAFVSIQKIFKSDLNVSNSARETNRERIINTLSAEPMSRGQIVAKLQESGPVNSQTIASLLSRLVSEGIAAKHGSGRYIKCETLSATNTEGFILQPASGQGAQN
jgi:hypothetical protein